MHDIDLLLLLPCVNPAFDLLESTDVQPPKLNWFKMKLNNGASGDGDTHKAFKLIMPKYHDIQSRRPSLAGGNGRLAIRSARLELGRVLPVLDVLGGVAALNGHKRYQPVRTLLGEMRNLCGIMADMCEEAAEETAVAMDVGKRVRKKLTEYHPNRPSTMKAKGEMVTAIDVFISRVGGGGGDQKGREITVQLK